MAEKSASQKKKKRINISSSESLGSLTAATTKRESFKPSTSSKTLTQSWPKQVAQTPYKPSWKKQSSSSNNHTNFS